MILKGVRVAMGANLSWQRDLIIRYGRISFSSKTRSTRVSTLDLSGFMVLPGLVNAHDHLEFNLFPRLGRGPYPNAAAWAKDIYRPQEEPIAKHLQVPKPLRLWWGGLKNLLSGVTSVVHHNPYDPAVFDRDFPVRVIRRFGWAHSLAFSADVVNCFRHTPSGAPFIMHAAEGTDEQSRREIHCLKKAQVLRPSTVLVHGVAINSEDVDVLRSAGASLIWCPSSNLFTLGQTLSPEVLHSGVPIALGSDSALTAGGDLIDEIELASHYVNLGRVYGMVTGEAARILRLGEGQGMIQEGGFADLLVVHAQNSTPAAALAGLRPELVFLKGQLKLISASLASHLRLNDLPGFEPVEIEGRGKWLVEAKVRSFVAATQRVLGEDFCLAGRRVIA